MPSRRPLTKTIAIAVALAIALAWIITQVAGVYTESINWDELALFKRATQSLATGHLQTGGRPGLGVLLLMPFARGCTHTMETIHVVRLVWVAFTVGILAGVYGFLLCAVRNERLQRQSAAVGTALWALVPVVLRWSLQVRTDQPSVCFALWGAVLILISRRRTWLALGGGALIGVGYLFSQKAVYVAALAGCVALGDVFRDSSFVPRRELIRGALVAAGLAAVIALYKLIIFLCFVRTPNFAVTDGLATLENYRSVFGYRLYASMLPTLAPHLAVLAAAGVCLARASRRDQAERRDLLLALSVATLGVAIGWFHAGAFPYFWMTLGLFPAIAAALAWPYIATALGRWGHPAFVALCVWLLWFAIPYRREVLVDTQDIQRQSLSFIENVLPSTARGFSSSGALFCRGDRAPLPTYFREAAEGLGSGPDPTAKQQAFIHEFRARPISFIVDTFLLNSFPQAIRDFWKEHYVRYAYTVSVSGRLIEGTRGDRIDFDVIEPGRYVWYGQVPIDIDGHPVMPGQAIELTAAVHPITLDSDTRPAALAIALPVPPIPDIRAFYAHTPIAELLGERTSW